METESDSDDNKSPPPATAASPPPATAASPPPATTAPDQQPPLSKRAQKKLLKQQRFEAKKAEKKAQLKEHKQREAERKRREWAERLAGMSEEEKLKLIEERKSVRRERMEKRSEEKGKKIERLTRAKESGQNFVIDLEFSDLMTSNELQSLVQQIMYCYAMNGRCETPAHLWLAGYQGEMQNLLEKTPGYDKWLIEKESRPYIEAFQDQKENLVYLTADSENVLDELDPKKVYIIGGLVDRNRWKGITMNKAKEQGIQTAKLPIGNYLKMSSSQVLTVNQVVEILLKFLELRDWKASFFEVIPQRKRCEADSEGVQDEPEGEDNAQQEQGDDHQDRKRQCIEGKQLSNSV
nr:tRNA (guanine(9)-N1)-methyltransferase [Ipomoea batatas]